MKMDRFKSWATNKNEFSINDSIDVIETTQFTSIEAKYDNVVDAFGVPRKDHPCCWWTFTDNFGHSYALGIENEFRRDYLIGAMQNKTASSKYGAKGKKAWRDSTFNINGFRSWLLSKIKDSVYDPQNNCLL